ncbi:hypothetical protein [Ligilactobacillus acidipiscis]|uniref:hypothetical protein n=1 Tax=Ligilactobacillus acidipiscis TaxID=89059 RepID=UPI0022E8A560|nr:hypothetical protein [Ligilactobacillus acidipiscis]
MSKIDQVKHQVVEMMSSHVKEKIQLEDLAEESVLLAKSELLKKITTKYRSLPDWVMAYFFGYVDLTGFALLDEQQEHILLLGVFNQRDEILRTEIFENQDKGEDK